MDYEVRLFEVDGASPLQLKEAQQRFRHALEDSLGDASLVAPVYRAYLDIVAQYGDQPAPGVLNDAEQAVFEQWQSAETAAVAAAFGSHRYMGDATYEIRI